MKRDPQGYLADLNLDPGRQSSDRHIRCQMSRLTVRKYILY